MPEVTPPPKFTSSLLSRVKPRGLWPWEALGSPAVSRSREDGEWGARVEEEQDADAETAE